MNESLERGVIRAVIGVLGLIALGYDGLSLAAAWDLGGLLATGRAISAIGLGWMCGWYFTVRFQPTSGWLQHHVLAWAGHVVAALTAACAAVFMGLMDLLAPSGGDMSYFGLTTVTFAPVASYFATQLSDDRSVHLVSGFGIGALTYVVLFGVPG
ncbi:MAG: hypothetical protein H6741_26695 [Alphaproteobacteria bacterium]|nr:hypothetical protein [Alphaproteobacteria bacterium]